jgi:hypothetical protein
MEMDEKDKADIELQSKLREYLFELTNSMLVKPGEEPPTLRDAFLKANEAQEEIMRIFAYTPLHRFVMYQRKE